MQRAPVRFLIMVRHLASNPLMIRSYLKIIFRNFFSDGMYTSIIVFGLAIGISVSLIIGQYIHFELSFDKEIKDRDRIYYTYMNWQEEKRVSDALCHPAVGPLIKRSVPEVTGVIRIVPAGLSRGDEWILRREKNGVLQDYGRINNMYLADPEVLDFFSIPMLEGDPLTALVDPHSIVITKSVADKFFPNESPINKTLNILIYEFRVTGIMEDPLPNSTLQYNTLISIKFLENFFDETYLETNWIWNIFQTFIKINPEADKHVVEKKINDSAAPHLSRLQKDYNVRESIHLYPFRDFHFYKPFNSAGVSPVVFTGDRRIVGFFTAIAFLIMIICWANYINLTIARALRRAKEVGVRKVSGADRKSLILQFLSEFFFLNITSLMVAFTLTQLLFSSFAAAIGSRAEWVLWREPWFWLVVIVFLILSTLVSGIYPAFVMSNYNPVKVLKGNFSRSQSGVALRKGLVLVQFGLSAFLLMSIYVISKQLIFMQTRDLGMSTEQVLVVRLDELDSALNRITAFEQWKTRIQDREDVVSGAAISAYPGDRQPRGGYYQATNSKDTNVVPLETNIITEDYFKTMSMELLYGRTFRDDRPIDTTAVIVNETAAHLLGFENPESAIGQEIIYKEANSRSEIIGVVKDFSSSLKNPAYGSAFHYKEEGTHSTLYFLVRLSTSNLTPTLVELQNDWETLFNGAPFDYFFLDTYFDTFYKEERQFAGVFGFFSVVGIAVTCMGLFGLSMYNTGSRTKEIGIRKSLGGSPRSIMWMFSKEYMSLVLAAS
jgi:putative ABC transport system permease protein